MALVFEAPTTAATATAYAVPGVTVTLSAATATTGTRYYLATQSSEKGVATADPYGEFLRVNTGKTLVKRDGSWFLVRNKRQDWLEACDYVYRGGYANEVPSGLVAEIRAAGFTVDAVTVEIDLGPSTVVGSASGTLVAVAGNASGQVSGPGSAAGGATVSAAADGVVSKPGSAAGAATVSGSASGFIQTNGTWGSLTTWGAWTTWGSW